MTRSFSLRIAAVSLALLLPFSFAWGQGMEVPEPAELLRAAGELIEVPTGGSAKARVKISIAEGWHVNANPPSLDYMIPTEARVTAAGGLSTGPPVYPEPRKAKLSFEESELLVYDGQTTIEIPVTATPTAALGERMLEGKIQFQACNDQVCLAPASVAFTIPVRVVAGVPGLVTADTAAQAPAAGGLVTAPPAGATNSIAAKQRLEDALAAGGLVWFLGLFAGGLLLNLTPCVFPMLGVTVSIFGARRQEPLPKVMTAAALYVMGIVLMYSALGVAAALTGGLFGAALQNTWVNVGLGALLIGLSLSMFGFYEMQPPAWLLARIGGANATSAAGLLLSGLAVGVIAAPCVGPFVVAVLALIAQRGDALFGFQTMFAVALGLGFPYLVLAGFSNLLQSLPRSGNWMVWVKKAFGVILASVGLFYVLLAIAPDWAIWVMPAALVAGGILLGYVDRSADNQKGFRPVRIAIGTLALIAGLVVIVTTPTQTVAFQAFEPTALQSGLSGGRAAMIDFSADWCVPCHELERNTFTDSRVRALARSFLTYKVDLTRSYNTAEGESLRSRYGIKGVPTVVFLGPDGREVIEARVEGFLPPGPFLERMRYAGERTGALANR